MRIKLSAAILIMLSQAAVFAQPVSLHPQNRHYLSYKGNPLLLITSAEHYGAVINLEFDFVKYLDTLAREGMNYTRIFTGYYLELPGHFGIANNTLAPRPNHLLVPWQRSPTPGYANGGNKFDLDKWDGRYFERLKKFVAAAYERNIIIEVALFSSFYHDGAWRLSPLHPGNNVNETPAVEHRRMNTLENGRMLAYQEELVRKLVHELNAYDNVFFEIQNEPYADNGVVQYDLSAMIEEAFKKDIQIWRNRLEIANPAALAWQNHMVDLIVAEEAKLPKQHLIAQNICNFKYPVRDLHPQVAILNFHYALPEAVALNHWLDRVVSFDESGFSGHGDLVYRRQAWKFVLAGGGIFNNLDYSFTVGYEDGTCKNEAPGGGGPALRQQLKILKEVATSCDLVNMIPGNSFIVKAPGVFAYGMSQRGKAYLVYLEGNGECQLTLAPSPGKYRIEWINPTTGRADAGGQIEVGGGAIDLSSSKFADDVVLRLLAIP